MIDTVILSVPKEKVTLLDTPSKQWDTSTNAGFYAKFTRNASGQEKKDAGYFPRLTAYKRKRNGEIVANLKIEFSAPKLIYENNIDELEDDQFEAVLNKLQEQLFKLGVSVKKEDLRHASVCAVHYSKNIQLTDGYTSQYVISELNKINPNKRFDLTRARFANDGQSLYIYTQAHSFVIYDKVADLNKGKKRSIDRDQTFKQLSLFEELANNSHPEEILRLEVRLSQKRKLNSLFRALNLPDNPNFQQVFDHKKSELVLQHYWNTLVADLPLALFGHNHEPKEVLKQILLNHPEIKPKQAIYQVGLLLLAKDGNGFRELRTVLSPHMSNRSWYRVIDDLQGTREALPSIKPRTWYRKIQESIGKYRPYRVGM